MKKRKKHFCSPEKRGAMSEATVDCALRWLCEKREIENFFLSDGDGKDFIVVTKAGEKQCIEVKSSPAGEEDYRKRKELLRRYGRKVREDVLVVVVDRRDTLFSIAERLISRLS